MSEQKYYAVVTGKVSKPTIFGTWEQCKKAAHGVSQAKYKSFDNLESAKAYIRKFKGNAEIVIDIKQKKKKKPGNKKKKVADPVQEPKKIEVYREIFQKHDGSTGENVIEMHLKMLKLQYLKEFKVMIDGYEFRFDFAILANDKLVGFVEFDGQQHFEAVGKFGGAEGLRKTQFRDAKKNEYCERRGLKLLRIKYCDGHKSKDLITKAFKAIKSSPKEKTKLEKIEAEFTPIKKQYFNRGKH